MSGQPQTTNQPRAKNHPRYFHVFLTFARNSLVRDMSFRANFIIDAVSSTLWVCLNLAFYTLIFHYTPEIGKNTGWGQYEYFLFYGSGLLINSVIQTFFMANADELSELVRTGTLDFALLKPIDTQFLVSLVRIDWSSLGNFALGLLLIGYSLFRLHYLPGPLQAVLYVVYVLCGVAIYYSLMFSMAATSVWLGRNATLFDFWFYITNFSRYPMEIYHGPIGTPLRRVFTFVIPVLIVVNVPARQLLPALTPQFPEQWLLPVFALFAAVGSLAVSRWIFTRALASYRSASS